MDLVSTREGQTVRRRGGTNRREFLVASGGSLVAVSLFGLSACGDEDDATTASGDVLMNLSPDVKDIVTAQVEAFNKQNPDGEVTTRITPSDTGQAFDQLRTQFQGGGSDIDVIMGDIIWPPQFAANGWILDLSDRFTEEDREQFIPGVDHRQHLRGQDLRGPVVHGRGLSLLPHRPARGRRLQ